MIRASGVGYTFASKRVGLAGVDLDVKAGELVALIGPNGSGKTTLLRILANDLTATAGQLSVSAHQRAFAPAQAIQFDELSGLENARFFARALGASDDAVQQQLTAFNLLADAGIAAGEYSFGMQRKLMLAEVLAAKCDLLLLDEPTMGLDPEAVGVLRDSLQDHVRAGNAVLFGTNDVRFAMHATRVVFLHKGRKISDGAPAELLGDVHRPTRMEVTLSQEPVRPPVFPVNILPTRIHGGFILDANDAKALPEVCGALIAAGATISAVRVREPDLGDVFRALTGEALKDDADA